VAAGLWVACAVGAQAATDLARYVNPFIGTDGTGHVFPGAIRPFGMAAPGPDNAAGGWDYTSGYQYRAPKILGFSNTHISGAGIPDLGDVLLQPSGGERWDTQTTDFSSGYDKRTESASPGHYAVTLKQHGVRVELTATQRVAVHRYTFSRPGTVQVLVDLQHGLQFGDQPRVTDSRVQHQAREGDISGTVTVKGWTERELSFVIRFSTGFKSIQTLPARAGEKAARLLLSFDLGSRRTLHARVALSLVRRIVRSFYGDGPDGIIGNDDCGQLSAWYVLSTLGLYPVQPGSGHYALGAPQVRAARLQLGAGRSLELRAPGLGPRRPYAAAAWLQVKGRPPQRLDPTAVPHAALVANGILQWQMQRWP
jgi:putative alpha-1,2-mannosidase